jgi:hypothetical protein
VFAFHGKRPPPVCNRVIDPELSYFGRIAKEIGGGDVLDRLLDVPVEKVRSAPSRFPGSA